MTYKLLKITSLIECEPHAVIRKSDNAVIPFDAENRDYKKYLAWVADGNTADPADDDKTWNDIRADRDQRLKETDWTQMPDVPQETIWKWKTYRQDLRDIPQKQTDPNNITWPTKPS